MALITTPRHIEQRPEMKLQTLMVSAAMILAVCSVQSLALPVPGGTAKVSGPNPHKADAACGLCHAASEDVLNSWFSLGSTKRRLTNDPTALCQKCHGLGFGHGVGKHPKLNREDLPLTEAGTIACALTCHNMHLKNPADAQQKRYMLRLPISRLCASCHDN